MQPSYRSFAQPPSQRSPHVATTRRGIGPMISGGHPQSSLTPAQIQAQQESQRQASELAKRRSRKPTDKNIPEGVEECIIGDGVQRYKDLRDVERKLDAAMMRKKLDIQDARNRNVKRHRTLRLWISNTVEDQPWQADSLDVDTFDFANQDSSYRVKIEGRLLDDEADKAASEDSDDEDESPDVMRVDGQDETEKAASPKSPQKYRFSHFFKSISVDFERNRARDGTEQSVEWKKPAVPANATNLPSAADFDQLEFKRGSDENLNVTFNLVRDESPERFSLSSALAEIMDNNEATRAEIVTGIWAYIEIMGLQEDDEKRSFRCDDLLKQIIPRESGFAPQIPDAINAHIMPLPPLKLPYTIRVDQAFHANPQPTMYDIRVTLPDPLTSQLNAFNANPAFPATLREISTLNDQLATLVQAIGHSKAKHLFLTGFSKDPCNFAMKWMSSQKRDLEIVMGEATRGGGEDAMGEEFRKGGKAGIWGSEHVRESVNLMLSSRAR